MSAGEAGEAERAAELAAHGLQRGAPLGRGSFGTVYGGRDVLAGGEPVALKYLPVSTSDVERLTTEVGVLSHLSHPHIVCLRRVVRLQASLVVVMQRAFGGDLRALLERAPGGVLGEDQTRRILRQLARGLRYAHSKKVIHRDLKLENVLIKGGEEPDHVLLADFGLSQLGHGRMTESLLSRSGSLYYMVRRRRPCSALHPFPAPHPPPPPRTPPITRPRRSPQSCTLARPAMAWQRTCGPWALQFTRSSRGAFPFTPPRLLPALRWARARARRWQALAPPPAPAPPPLPCPLARQRGKLSSPLMGHRPSLQGMAPPLKTPTCPPPAQTHWGGQARARPRPSPQRQRQLQLQLRLTMLEQGRWPVTVQRCPPSSSPLPSPPWAARAAPLAAG